MMVTLVQYPFDYQLSGSTIHKRGIFVHNSFIVWYK